MGMESTRVKLILLCMASFLVATAVAWGVFEAVPHLEDEHANYFQAKVFAAGRLTNPAPPVPEAFYVPFAVIQDGRKFSKYPPGYALVLALGMLVRQPWLVNSLLAAVGIYATYLLARDLYDQDTGLLAAALGVVSPTYIMLSGTLLSNISSLAALALFAWAFSRTRRESEACRSLFALAAGGLIGWAFISRPWSSVASGLPFAVLASSDVIRRPRQAFPVYAWMAAAFCFIAILLPAYTYAATGSPFTNLYRLWWPYDSVGFGPHTGRNGHTFQKAVINFRVDFPIFNQTALGWPVWFGIPLTWLVASLAIALPPRRHQDWMLLAPPVALIVAHLAYWAHSGGLYGVRYYSEALPFIWIVASRGLLKLGTWTITRRAVQIILPGCMIWGIACQTAPRFQDGRGLYGITRADSNLIINAGLKNALVIVDAPAWTDYGSLSWLNQIDLLDGEIIFARDRGPEANARLVRQFSGRKVYYYSRHQEPRLILYQDHLEAMSLEPLSNIGSDD